MDTFVGLFLALVVACTLPFQVVAAEGSSGSPALPDEPEAAWAQINKVHQALAAPREWRKQAPTGEELAAFGERVRRAANSFAGEAREFIARFPANPHAGEARILVVYTLSQAVAAGDTNAERAISAFVKKELADTSIPENDRAGVLLYAGNVPFMKQVGMRFFTEGLSRLEQEFESNSIKAAEAALSQFPSNSLVSTMLVSTAQRAPREQQKAVGKEILDTPGVSSAVKALAQHLVDGTKPYRLGEPLDIKFKSLDGADVDLSRMTNKVVLVDFWATTCGPCVAEMPKVKAVYEKFHGHGFEVVGINLDDSEASVRRFIRQKAPPWPQYFDGKGWENKFAVRYGIFSIPTLWLVDKHGKLRTTEARFGLDRQVESLLAAP
jgi:thiol-disulfide isomerase/thioredoxin